MSSISLLKDHEGQKKGTVVSVPFLKGRELIASGVGEWYDAGPNMKQRPAKVPEPPKVEPVVEPVKAEEVLPAAEPDKQETNRRPRRNG